MSIVSPYSPSSYAVMRLDGFIPNFIETSGDISEFVKVHVVNLAEKGLRQVGKKIYGSKVAVMGLAYKKNIYDHRESPSIKITEEPANLGVEAWVYDPFVPSIRTKKRVFASVRSVEEAIRGVECAIFPMIVTCSRGSLWRR